MKAVCVLLIFILAVVGGASSTCAQNTFYKPRPLKQPEASPDFEEAKRLALEQYRAKQDEEEQRKKAIYDELTRRALADMREYDKARQIIREDAEERTNALLGRPCRANLATFEAIRFGASLVEAREAFNCVGRMTDGARISGVGTFQSYAFDSASGSGVAVLTFRGGRLMSKSQDGLP